MAQVKRCAVYRTMKRIGHIIWRGAAITVVSLVTIHTDAAAQAKPRGAGRTPFVDPILSAADSAAPLTRYASPDACVAAVRRIRRQAYWSQDPDTLPVDSDRVLPAEAQAARTCGRHFSMDSVLERSLGALQQLALLAGDDAWAGDVVRRRVTLAARQPVVMRADILADALMYEVNAIPARFDVGDRLARALDSLGADAAQAQARAYDILASRAMALDSMTRARAYAARYMTAVAKIPREQRDDGWARETAEILALASLPMSGPLSDTAVRHYRETMTQLFGAAMAAPFAGLVGLPAPAVTGEFWPDSTTQPAIRPVAHRPSLVIFLDSRCGTHCVPDITTLKRLTARFGTQMDVVTSIQTRGFFRSVLLTDSSAEAGALRDYFSAYRQLPGTLVIATTPFTRRPAPDRRRVDHAVPTVQRYGASFGQHYDMTAVVVGTDGRVLWPPISLSRYDEPLFARLLGGR
jgi:hypothetical protein